jgi:putative ABC transport system permease protein
MWTLLREVSLRHLRHSPLRTGLVIFGIALGVCMLCAVLATNDSLVLAFEDMVDRVAGKADLTVAGSEAGIPSSLTGEIADLPGVEHAAAMLEVVTRSPDGQGGSLLVLGVDFLGDTFFLPFAQEGKDRVVDDPLAFANDPTAILVSRKLAKARGLKVGDKLPLVTSEGDRDFYVRGLLEDKGPAASFGGQVVVMFIDAAQVSFARGYAVDRIDIVIKQGHQLDDVQAAIAKLVKGKAQVEKPKGRTQRLVASLWAFKNGLNMSGLVALWVGMFLIYNAVSVSVAQRRREVGILRALGVTKRRMVSLFCLEALIMATVGIGLGLLLAQQLAQLALANVEGTVNRFVLPIHPPPPTLSARVILAGILSGFVTTLFASYWPARQTNQVDPAEALRATRSSSMTGVLRYREMGLMGACITLSAFWPAARGGEVNGYLASLVLMVGLTLLVPVAVKTLRFLLVPPVERLLGIPGRLALDNVERSLGRSAITVVALMLAVGMSMSIGAYARSFEKSVVQWADDAFPADATVTAGSPLVDRHHVSFAPSVLEKLQGIPGVVGINPTRIMFQDVFGKRAQLAAMDTRTYLTEAAKKGRGRRVVEGPAQLSPTALASARRVVVSENIANVNGLAPGSTVKLSTPSGERAFEVYAVVLDYSSDQGWMMIDRKWFLEDWHDEQIDEVDLFFAPEFANAGSPGTHPASDQDRDALVNIVRGRLSGMQSLFVTLHDGLRKQLRAVAVNIFAIAKAPELITLLVAIMGVIGTMLAAVIDRIREIGMLRAIGATRRQVVLSLVAEAGFLGFSSVVCGVIGGVPQGYIFLKVIGMATSGWDLPYGFPLDTAVRMTLFVVGAAAFAGFFPGRRASAMDVKEALAYE